MPRFSELDSLGLAEKLAEHRVRALASRPNGTLWSTPIGNLLKLRIEVKGLARNRQRERVKIARRTIVDSMELLAHSK